jgi:prepilin-type N-terminal cleavage/methylation domain-containing protein
MRKNGFTLVELLAVVVILAILLSAAVATTTRFIEKGRMGKEISAARKITSAYLMYAADHDGNLMPGYQSENVTDATGQSIEFPANARYPWRLASYLDYDMHAILFNGNENALKDQVDFHYAASVSPNLGMNVTFVGGDYGSGSDLAPSAKANSKYGAFCITKLTQAVKPSWLIVFASARRTTHDVGFYQVKSPSFIATRWSGVWDPKAPAEAYGFVDMRYDRKAVAAMLDGHVEMLDEDGIQDMRHWSNQAADQDKDRFTLQKL